MEHLSRGEIAEGVALLEQQRRVIEIADTQQRILAIARSYAANPDNTIVVSPDNASRRQINQAVRSELQAIGAVAAEDHATRVLVPRSDMTGADRTWAARYAVNDILHYPRGSQDIGVAKQSYTRVIATQPRDNLLTVQKEDGKTVTYSHCPVHDPATAARLARQQAEHPAPVMEPAPEQETPEEAEQRQAEYEQRRAEHEAELQRNEEERKAEFERQQKEYEASQKRREKLSKARSATFDRILEQAPAMFTAAQLRVFLRLLLQIDPYSFLEDVASHFAGEEEDRQLTDEEIILAALGSTADDKLTSFALRLILTDHVAIPLDNQPDPLSEAEAAFAPPPPKPSKTKEAAKAKAAATDDAASPQKTAARKRKAA